MSEQVSLHLAAPAGVYAPYLYPGLSRPRIANHTTHQRPSTRSRPLRLRCLSRLRGGGQRLALARADNRERPWLLAGACPVEDAAQMLGGAHYRVVHRQQDVAHQQASLLARATSL